MGIHHAKNAIRRYIEGKDGTMRKYSKELYTKEVVMKTAFAFTDNIFIHIDVNDKEYLITLKAKNDIPEEEMYAQFENELIAQETRLLVAERTKNIREMIVARSLSSTIVNIGLNEQEETEEFNADEILTDWFDGEDE